MKNYTICSKKIILKTIASKSANRYGGKASDYSNLFLQHSDCVIAKREKETLELMRRLNNKGA